MAKELGDFLKNISWEDEVTIIVDKNLTGCMRAPGKVFLNKDIKKQTFDELEQYYDEKNKEFRYIPSLFQIANVASMPGIVGVMLKFLDEDF